MPRSRISITTRGRRHTNCQVEPQHSSNTGGQLKTCWKVLFRKSRKETARGGYLNRSIKSYNTTFAQLSRTRTNCLGTLRQWTVWPCISSLGFTGRIYWLVRRLLTIWKIKEGFSSSWLIFVAFASLLPSYISTLGINTKRL